MQLSSLLKILQMNIAYNDPEGGQPIEEVFIEQEIEVLAYLNKTLQGKNHKTQNLNNTSKTKFAAWIIGRLGGWKGYDSQDPPGFNCLKKGLERFNRIIEGIKIAKDMYTAQLSFIHWPVASSEPAESIPPHEHNRFAHSILSPLHLSFYITFDYHFQLNFFFTFPNNTL